MSKLSVIKDAAEKAFEAESGRREGQVAKAEKFVAGTAAIMSLQVFESKQLLKEDKFKLLVLISLIFLALAFLFAFLSMRVKGFVGFSRGSELPDLLKDEDANEETAEQEITNMLLQAREQNARLNDKNADLLRTSGWFILAGFVVVVATQLLKGLL